MSPKLSAPGSGKPLSDGVTIKYAYQPPALSRDVPLPLSDTVWEGSWLFRYEGISQTQQVADHELDNTKILMSTVNGSRP